MQPAEARRSERIHYRGQVELLAEGEAIEPRSVLGEAIDLGVGGMRVAAEAQMAVGAAVTCKLDLDGSPAALSGRVAWASGGEAPHGIGIRFEALSGSECALLKRLLEGSQAGYRAVELRFANLKQPILARARRRTNGLRLTAALPILARGSQLSFRLNDEGPLLIGRIAGAELREDADARRLEVDVDVIDQDGVRFRRNARYGFPNEIERADEARPAPPAVPPAAPPVVEPMAEPAAPGETQRTAATTEAVHRGALRALLPFAASAAIGAAVGLLAAALARQPASAPPRGAPAPAAHAATAEVAPTPEPAVAPTPEPSVQSTAPEAPDLERETLERPELRVVGRTTRVRMPFEGSLAHMRVLLWAAPYALNLYLPEGRVLLPAQRVRARAGGVSGLALTSEKGEQLVRVKLASKLAQYAVKLDSGTLELSLVHE